MMTENLLQTLEDKIVKLLSEFEKIQHEVLQLKSENDALRAEKANSQQKVQGMVILLDACHA